MNEEERVGSSSSSSSSLPVSYGVDCEKYDFSSSVSSLSQPFSPEGSSNKSHVLENNLSFVFSLDHNSNSSLMVSPYHTLEFKHCFLSQATFVSQENSTSTGPEQTVG